ncbi:nitroreductase family deazaflavin-dependent oxidoreductase [Nonomuraea sp. NEAU-A123]|uniref:nitroreductase family deazaflavin-dependent oxidoreductase n=1 Tax=Nonomuraea sp. NEAU-A123 TaxID=2839649 RepID=UPI001BE42BB4|nr:nitroreductase family deazaflavin-dependent oxidoreductase [Nonomuraea sp. NEAU-A123]MBT2230869.1 nitroreductase family deazaflavin-dependent oxidoreductase [Nonomuraea sp. NEAU-A123]
MANEFNDQIIAEFRANKGKVGGMFEGANLVLLTTTGAKSGNRTTSPVMYFEDGDRYIVIASYAGADHNPAWYHNLRANPEVTAEIGTETFEVEAEVVEGEERDELYARMVEIAPGFAEYQAKTTRRIPVVALRRRAA